MRGRVEGKGCKTLYLVRIGIIILIAASMMPIMARSTQILPRIIVFQENSPTMPIDINFTYLLEPDESNNPMPLGSTAQGFIFSIAGDSSKELVFVENIGIGVYSYKLNHVINEKEPEIVYDQRSYRIELHIGEDLDATFIVLCEEGLKVDKIIFENDFQEEEEEEDPTPKEPSTPGKPSLPGKPPATGDNMSFWLEITGIIMGIGIFVFIIMIKRTEKKKTKKRELSDL